METQTISINKDIINKYICTTATEKFLLDQNICFNYLVLVSNADINIDIQTKWNYVEWNIFAICFWKWKLKSKIKTHIKNSECKINVFILSFLQDNNIIDVDWDVVLGKNISNSQWHLMEKNIIFWDKINVKMAPKLDVYSQNVQATHGVSIDKIDPEKKFYLKSRGLSNQQSIELIVHSYIQYILKHFHTIDENQKKEIENIILSNIQIND